MQAVTNKFSTNQLWILTMIPAIVVMMIGGYYGHVLGGKIGGHYNFGWLLTRLFQSIFSFITAQIIGSISMGIILVIIRICLKDVWNILFLKPMCGVNKS